MLLELLDRLYMLIYNIGETSCVNATKTVFLTLYLVENYDVARKERILV